MSRPPKGRRTAAQNQAVSKTPGQVQADEAVYVARRMYQHSVLTARAEIANRMNTQFRGKRDMAEALGYPNDPDYTALYNLYQRDGMAARIVDAISDETWRNAPILQDGALSSDNPDDIATDPFLRDFDDLVKDYDLLNVFSDADAVGGYSRFAVIFLGLPGDFRQPATGGPLKYLNVFDEGHVQVTEIERDTTSPRYGRPLEYNILFEGGGKAVHWTRVIHICEGRNYSPIYGTPRLYRLIDRLYDLVKVVGGGSEAFWLSVFRGIAFLAREGGQLPRAGTPEADQMQDDIEEYIHGLNRYLQLSGVDVQDLGGSAVDGNGQFQVIIACLAGVASIPKRILIGSEMGELASSQDDKNFADTIAGRQTRFAEVRILRAFIDRCIALGIIAKPQKPRYTVKWPSLFELNPLEKSQQAVNVASALSTMTGGVPDDAMTVADFTREYLDYTLPEVENADQLQTPETQVDPEAPAQGKTPAPGIPPGQANA